MSRQPPRRVYPRAGGETPACRASGVHLDGLSPRGRGNLSYSLRPLPVPWSIPARAGKPPSRNPSMSAASVYPRAGGETLAGATSPLLDAGLSPRGRGNRHPGRDQADPARSIPARAGKPKSRLPRSRSMRVYPRAGGETGWQLLCLTEYIGLSPRGRGNRVGRCKRRCPRGSIPARAGKPQRYAAVHGQRQVYPRAGGETHGQQRPTQRRSGLSPRGRGNRRTRGRMAHGGRSIPARAGKPGRGAAAG